MKTKQLCLAFVVVLVAACSFSRSDAQFAKVKACLKAIDVKQAGLCFATKFSDLIDAVRPNKSPATSSEGYKSDFDDIVSTLYSDTSERTASSKQLHKVRGIGANTHPLRSYLSKLQRDSELHLLPPGHQDSLATLVDVFDDVLAILERTGSLQQDSAHKGETEELLVELHRRKLVAHTKQLVLGRIVPTPVDELGGRFKYLNDLFQSYDDEDQLASDNEGIQELVRITKCLRDQDEETYEDSFQWLTCFFTCKDLPPIASCIENVFMQTPACSDSIWFGDMFIRLFTDFMRLDKCYFDIVSSPVALVEGGSTEEFVFRSYLPPGVHCFPPDLVNAKRPGILRILIQQAFKLVPPCNVVIYATTSNYLYNLIPYVPALNVSMPRCRNGSSINQIAIGWHENAVNASGIIPLTMDNWNSTFRLPLAAVIDQKSEKPRKGPGSGAETWNITVQFTLKFVVDGTRINTTKTPITVVDTDAEEPTTCQSINDPHIVTFDGLFYNNLYQGYFLFYKHDTLPYEVQVAYQACNVSTPESCNCGVAMRFGDDVFVVDKCRRHVEDCPKDDSDCRIMRVALYLNGDLTPGTNIYQTDEGLGFQVVLPTGERLKVKSIGDFLNVWFTPSMYDWNSTQGLCGVFNGKTDDDLTLPNGTKCSSADCNVSPGFQPRSFIEAWRLPYNETIFNGATPIVNDSFIATNFCRCSHVIVAGIRCVCGYDMRVETCDIDLGNAFTSSNISALFVPTRKSEIVARDFDLTFVPQTLTYSNKWPETKTRDYCKTMLQYRPVLDPIPPYFVTFCENDIQIVGEPRQEWELSVLEAVKEYKTEVKNRKSKFELLSDGSSACINSCYNRGTCVNGTCSCDKQYYGPDCSQVKNNPALVMGTTTLCDVRSQNCSFATVFGESFYDNSMQCNINSVSVLEPDVKQKPIAGTVGVLYVSPNQLACRLTTYMTSYKIAVVAGGSKIGNPFTFMAYDSECYVCNVGEKRCTLKERKSYCYVDGTCYANQESSATDACMLCNISSTTQSLSDSQDPVCVQKRIEESEKKASDKKEKDLRIIVSVCLSGGIVLVTIIAFVVNHHFEKKAQKKASTQSNSSLDSYNDSDEAKGRDLGDDAAAEQSVEIQMRFNSPSYANAANKHEEDDMPPKSNEKTEQSKTVASPDLQSRINGVQYVIPLELNIDVNLGGDETPYEKM